MATNIAYKAGRCGSCGTTIALGDTFAWGPYGSKTRLCMGCAAAPAAVEATVTSLPAPNDRLGRGPGASAIALTPEQEAACVAAIEGETNICVEAVAGSGKTSYLEALGRRILHRRPDASIGYFVFNNRNMEEAQKRMPAEVEVRTFHSIGLQSLRAKIGTPKIDGKKLWGLLDTLQDITDRDLDQLGTTIVKLTELAKRHGVGAITPDVEPKWLDLMDHYDVSLDVDPAQWPNGTEEAAERAVDFARRLLRASDEQHESIDFDDMLHLVLKLELGLPQFDYVLVDEAQDCNPARIALIRLMLKKTSTLVIVGDRRQAIYGFTGAEADALDHMVGQFACRRMPLTTNFRCDTSIIEVAQAYCPEIQAAPGKAAGLVETVYGWKAEKFTNTDAILCRTTAPLITLAYRLLGAGIPCKVLGRDIGSGLVSLLKKLQGKGKAQKSLGEIMTKLDQWEDREVARWTQRGQDEKVQSAQDKAASIRAAEAALMDDAQRTLAGLIAHIESIFGEEEADRKRGITRLTLSTVHKAKGGQWPTVYVLDPHRMPSPWAKKAWQKDQEENLIYVAFTRAEHVLRLVSLEDIEA